MAKRALLEVNHQQITLVTVADWAGIYACVNKLTQKPGAEYYLVDTIYLARQPEMVQSLSQVALRKVFHYNLGKGRVLKLDGQAFAFVH